MHNLKEDHMIFIGGSPRSGTTLVKRLLNSHSDIYCGPEFGHLPAILNQYNTMKKGIENQRMNDFFTLDELQSHYHDFILKLLTKPLEETNKSYLAEKTPGNIKVFPHLHEVFPNAKLLHVIRNPFDVVASFIRVGKRKDNLPEHYYNVRQGAIFWRQTVNWITRFETSKTSAFAEQYKLLKYEDLLENPTHVLEDLCNWMGVEFEEKMMELKEGKGDPATFSNVFYTREEYYKAFDTTNINKYLDILTKEDERIILEETKRELVKFGYMTQQMINEKLTH